MEDASTAAAAALDRRAWADVYQVLDAAERSELSVQDLERLGIAAYMTGRDDEAIAAWEEAYRRHLDSGMRAEGAEWAFWVAFCWLLRGQMAHAGGWLQRCESATAGLDCPAAGFLLIPRLLGALDDDDAATAVDLAVQAGQIGDRFGHADLIGLATLAHGQALLALGQEAEGLARLDEVMLSVSNAELGPIVSGVVYCAVILECMQLFDLSRAAEWTDALDDWSQNQQGLVPFRGQCLVHRSQLQQAAGDWPQARSTVEWATARLADPPHPALGLACYQAGELSRLRGEFDAAATAYRQAREAGYQPMPGLALLELARGDPAAAAASIQRTLRETRQPFQRPGLLAAATEILLAAGDRDGARDAATELASIASSSRSEALRALAEQAVGAVLLSTGDADDAMGHLRAASETWQRLGMPYETARTGALLGRGCLRLGDHSSAQLEFDNARKTLESLGAAPDLAELDSLMGGTTPDTILSRRELEVLGHVADGLTNREIAAVLTISQHTVGRHLENIFSKLGVNSRAAATAHAQRQGLI